MKDEQIRTQIHQAVDAHAEHLRTDPFLAQRIMNQERTGETVVKKRLSVGLVLAIVLMLLMATALAAGIIFAKRVPATEIADQALLQTYGITARMQSLFIRTTAEGEDGTTIVTYEGREHLAYVLGKPPPGGRISWMKFCESTRKPENRLLCLRSILTLTGSTESKVLTI